MRKNNWKKAVSVVLGTSLLLGLTACGSAGNVASSTEGEKDLTKITFCLDWTPNTNHTGIYAAEALGYYEDAGLDVEIVQPPTAVAAVLQHNTSGIISRAGEGIDSPKGLEGKTYSTWESPIELATLKTVVEEDGGDFSKVTLIPNDITDEPAALEAHQTDAIWIFYGWGGVNAEIRGMDFDYWNFRDINPVFDYYTPVIIANNDFLEESPDTAKAFMEATAKGYEYAVENPKEAADMLMEGDNTGSLSGSQDLVYASQEWISKQYAADADAWGVIDQGRWDAFYTWLYENKLTDKDLTGIGYSNDYLPQQGKTE